MREQFRLTQPLVRVDGMLRPASWEDALGRVERAFRRGLETQGPESFGVFSCSKTTNEFNYISQKFARVVLGTNNIDSCNRT